MVSVGDGIARVSGLNEIQAGEFASGVQGIIDLHGVFFLILILDLSTTIILPTGVWIVTTLPIFSQLRAFCNRFFKFNCRIYELVMMLFQQKSLFVYDCLLVFFIAVRIINFLYFCKGWASMSVLPDLNLPPIHLPDLPPLSEEEIQIVNDKILTRRSIERWIKAIYLSENRPKVEDPQDFSRMVDFIFMHFEDETLEEHREVLRDLQFRGSNSRYYRRLLIDWVTVDIFMDRDT